MGGIETRIKVFAPPFLKGAVWTARKWSQNSVLDYAEDDNSSDNSKNSPVRHTAVPSSRSNAMTSTVLDRIDCGTACREGPTLCFPETIKLASSELSAAFIPSGELPFELAWFHRTKPWSERGMWIFPRGICAVLLEIFVSPVVFTFFDKQPIHVVSGESYRVLVITCPEIKRGQEL